MNTEEFRIRGREVIDYIIEYQNTIAKRRVTPALQPGYLQNVIPEEAPMKGESFDDMMKDMKEFIVPGLTHWLHPSFCAFFPAGFSYPSFLADMLSDGIACLGFSWAACPACTELETIVLNWFGKMIGLPNDFLYNPEKSKGGGVLQGSASECTLVCLVAAREHSIKILKEKNPDIDDHIHLNSLVAYCSNQTHSSIAKAAIVGFVKLRILDTDSKYELRGSILEEAIESDIKKGLKPFFVVATIATTSCTSCDPLCELGPLCEKYGLWLHVDAAYGGSALICPELRHFLNGIEFATSININPTKWMLVHFDCSAMWTKRWELLADALEVNPLYLKHDQSEFAIDYRNWSISLSRRFRSLKLWFTIRNFGIEGLQNYIRNHIKLAKVFEKLVLNDKRFEVKNDAVFGLVCFVLKGSNELNEELLKLINKSGEMYMTATALGEQYVIRYSVNYRYATEEHIIKHWDIILKYAEDVLKKTLPN